MAAATVFGGTVQDSMKRLAGDKRYVEISGFPSVVVDLKYGGTDNFTGTNLYGEFKKCYLHKTAADKFRKSIVLLAKEKPGWKFIVYDVLRPRSIQRLLWAHVKGTPQQKYVADPDKGSNHNYGMALDVGLLDEKGKTVDMGAPYDGFTPLSEPQHEAEQLKSGQLTRQQVENRLILRRAMTEAGFTQLSHEWWHYDALTMVEIQEKKLPVIE